MSGAADISKKEIGQTKKAAGNDAAAGDESAPAGYSSDRGSAPRKLRFSYKEQREYETIESEIKQLEEQLEQLDCDMAANASSYSKLTELTAQKDEMQKLLDEKIERWMYLEELASRIKEENGK